MDFDEFQESDLMFSEYSYDQSVDNNNENNNDGRKRRHYKQSSNGSTRTMKLKNIPKIQKRIVASSAPMTIPSRDNSFRYDDDGVAYFESSDEDYEDNNSVDDQGIRLPPHIIVERRLSGEMARSFSPLKGRNLCEVRDNIFRMTGFLER